MTCVPFHLFWFCCMLRPPLWSLQGYVENGQGQVCRFSIAHFAGPLEWVHLSGNPLSMIEDYLLLGIYVQIRFLVWDFATKSLPRYLFGQQYDHVTLVHWMYTKPLHCVGRVKYHRMCPAKAVQLIFLRLFCCHLIDYGASHLQLPTWDFFSHRWVYYIPCV